MFKSQTGAIGKKRFLKLIYFYFLVPVIIMLISTFLVYNNYKTSFETELKSNYLSNLSALAGNIDNALSEMLNC